MGAVDDATLERIDQLSDGKGIRHMIVSHPHYYSTTAVWTRAFPKMKTWIAKVDFEEWYQRENVREAAFKPKGDEEMQALASRFSLFDDKGPHTSTTVENGLFTILQLGGHFPGSAVLLYKDILFIADTIQVVPSGLVCSSFMLLTRKLIIEQYHSDQPQRDGVATVSFLWRCDIFSQGILTA